MFHKIKTLPLLLVFIVFAASACAAHHAHSPEERDYLANLKNRHSIAPRTLTIDECRQVVDEACKFIGDATNRHGIYDSEDAKDLLLGTACLESGLSPSYKEDPHHTIGLFQIEYTDYKKIWGSICEKHPDLAAAIQKKFDTLNYETLQQNDILCAIFARMKYAGVAAPIPHKNDIRAQAAYYKKYYNAEHLATPDDYIAAKRRTILSHHHPAEHDYLAEIKKNHALAPRALTVDQCRHVIDEACAFIAKSTGQATLDTEDAKDLLFGTACLESGLKPRYQDNNHHAGIGLFQIEYATYKDLWNRIFKNQYPALRAAVEKKFGSITYESLQEHDVLSAIFARIKYAAVPAPIPHRHEMEAQALYFKKYFNTPTGDATVEDYIRTKRDILHLHHDPEEHGYLATLKERHSTAPRTITPAECMRIIDDACRFIAEVTGHVSYNTEDARDLLFGTACQESSLRPRYQDGSGHAIGLFQIEYPTFKDTWFRYVRQRHPDLFAATQKQFGDITYEALQQSDVLSAIIARMKYSEMPEKIPSKNNLQAQARYYKKYYNSPGGKATPEAYIKNKKVFQSKLRK